MSCYEMGQWTENSFIQSLQESSKWLNGKPVDEKVHVTSHMIIELCSVFKDSDDLMIFKELAMIVLSFAGFLRFDELSSLKCNDVSLFMIICWNSRLFIVNLINTDRAYPVSILDIMFPYLR
jgi:hypothetical protein